MPRDNKNTGPRSDNLAQVTPIEEAMFSMT
jgi:hypothetical protein